MDYKLKSPKLQDLVTRAETLVASAGELGTITAGELLIPASDIKDSFAATDVLEAVNVTLGEALVPTIAGTNLSLNGTSAILAAHVIRITVKV